jgi:hypothetical protein
MYIPILDYNEFYYDYKNTNKIYNNNKLININKIKFDLKIKMLCEPFITIVIDTKHLPILKINYKNKYIKYKSKFLKIKTEKKY